MCPIALAYIWVEVLQVCWCVWVVVWRDRCWWRDVFERPSLFLFVWSCPLGRHAFYACCDLLFPDMQEVPWVSARMFPRLLALRLALVLFIHVPTGSMTYKFHGFVFSWIVAGSKFCSYVECWHFTHCGSPCAHSRFVKVLDINVYFMKGLKTCHYATFNMRLYKENSQ